MRRKVGDPDQSVSSQPHFGHPTAQDGFLEAAVPRNEGAKAHRATFSGINHELGGRDPRTERVAAEKWGLPRPPVC